MSTRALVKYGRGYYEVSPDGYPSRTLRRLRNVVRKKPRSFVQFYNRAYGHNQEARRAPRSLIRPDPHWDYYYEIRGNRITIYESVPARPGDYKHWAWKKIRTVVVRPVVRRKRR